MVKNLYFYLTQQRQKNIMNVKNVWKLIYLVREAQLLCQLFQAVSIPGLGPCTCQFLRRQKTDIPLRFLRPDNNLLGSGVRSGNSC